MTSLAAILAQFPDLAEPVIVDWIARGWVRVEGARQDEWVFAEIDVARIRLIRELRIDMELDEQALPLVLSLLDQVYGLRRTLRHVMHALETQPDSVQDSVLTALAGPRSPLR